jgi:uncharacterized protein involved in exopolysaccharide biosynthesis
MNLKNILEVLWRQRVVVASVLVIGIAVFGFAVTKSRKYTATATVLAVSPSAQTASALDPSKDPTESSIALADVPSLLTSSTLVKQVGRDLHLTQKQTIALGASIKAKPSFGSSVLPVTVTDSDPNRAVLETNAVVRQLQKYEQQIAMSRYDLLVNDLQRQLSDRRAALSEIDRRIDDLTTNDPYVTYAAGTDAISTRLVALHAQRDQLQASVRGDASASVLMAQRPGLTRRLASQEIISNDPVFQSLRTQYGKDLAQLNNQRAGYTDKFPGLAGFSSQVTREAQSLADAQNTATSDPTKSAAYVSARLDQNKAQATLASDQSQLKSVDSQIDQMQSHLVASRAESTALASLRRDREAGNQAYARLADRLAVAEGDRAQSASINTIVLLDSATSAAPTLLSRPPLIAAALSAIFLWLAFTLAFLVDGIDTRLRSRTTIEELYGSPVFTTVG